MFVYLLKKYGEDDFADMSGLHGIFSSLESLSKELNKQIKTADWDIYIYIKYEVDSSSIIEWNWVYLSKEEYPDEPSQWDLEEEDKPLPPKRFYGKNLIESGWLKLQLLK
jgi:hypothetical protein